VPTSLWSSGFDVREARGRLVVELAAESELFTWLLVVILPVVGLIAFPMLFQQNALITVVAILSSLPLCWFWWQQALLLKRPRRFVFDQMEDAVFHGKVLLCRAAAIRQLQLVPGWDPDGAGPASMYLWFQRDEQVATRYPLYESYSGVRDMETLGLRIAAFLGVPLINV
jgi:hypothetical protein